MPSAHGEIDNPPLPSARALSIRHLLRPHWRALALAFAAVIVETVTDVMEPWPIKVVVDNLLQSKPFPTWWRQTLGAWFPQDQAGTLNLAVAAVALIAVVGAISAYAEKYLTTNVSQWIAHDLRLTLYHHIQRLSLA